MRGAPQVGFSRDILRIRSRVSRAIAGRPDCPRRTFQVQNKRKPMRCQATTVCGLTMASVERQSRRIRGRETQRRRSMEVSLGRSGGIAPMAATHNLPQLPNSSKSPISKSGVLTIHGFGVRVRMQSGHLEVEDGVGAERRTLRLPRVNHGLKRLVCISEDGFTTLS